VRRGAQTLQISLTVHDVPDTRALDGAFEELRSARPDALLVLADTFLVSQRNRIAQFALDNKLPSAFTYREHAEAGGLIAYAPSYHDLFRRAAAYVDKVLKGTKPADLPVQQPTKFDLLINLKTARALGLSIPDKVLVFADEVIE